MILSGLVFAGAGSVDNLAESNWIRDKGFGMSACIPRIVSPITGEEVAAPATGSMMRQDAENLRRFQRLVGVRRRGTVRLVLVHLRLLDHRVLDAGLLDRLRGGRRRAGPIWGFILAEGNVLKTVVAPWTGTFFWMFGALSIMFVALGVIDYIARIVADVFKTVYLAKSQSWSREPPLLLRRVATILAGSIPPVRASTSPSSCWSIAACLNGMVMYVYSMLLIQLDRARTAAGDTRPRSAARHAGLRDLVLRFLLGLAGHRADAELSDGHGERGRTSHRSIDR